MPEFAQQARSLLLRLPGEFFRGIGLPHRSNEYIQKPAGSAAERPALVYTLRGIVVRLVRLAMGLDAVCRRLARGAGWLVIGLVAAAVACGTPVEVPTERVDAHPLPSGALRVDTEGRPGGTLRSALQGSPSTFNFTLVQDLRSLLLTKLFTATLMEYDGLAKTVVPGVVSRWEIAEDARSIVLHLRRGLHFSDGEPLTAADVVFSFEKIYEEGSVNGLKNNLLVDGKPLEVEQLDEHSVVVRYAAPFAAMDYLLTTVPVLPRHRFQDPGRKIEDYWGLDTPPQEMAGLGPFVLAEHAPGLRSTFRHNPHYWKVDADGVRLPYLDRLEVHYVEDRNAQLLRLQSGELDLLLDSLRPEDFVRLREADNVQAINAGPGSRLTLCWFNLSRGINPDTGKPYLDPVKLKWFSMLPFRQAVDAAVSRQTIAENVFLGQAQPAFSLVPVSIPAWHAPEIRSEYDPERARRLLREAGFSWRRKGSGEVLIDAQGVPVEFSLLTPSESLWGSIAAILQHDLEELGMQVRIRQEEFRSVVSAIGNSRDYEMALLSLDFPSEPVDHGSVLLSDGATHFWHPNQSRPATEWEAEIDRLMRLQTSTLDLEQRRRLYNSVLHLLADNVPFIPLINRDLLIAGSSRVRNLRPSNISPYALWNVWELWVE